MKHGIIWLALAASVARAAGAPAKNVILFLADAGGIPTLSGASIYAHQDPQKLFIHGMPHIGLSETSSASRWVTDSAAGMTAIVTGHKTHNGVIAQSRAAERGKRDGDPLKTILEHAEDRGLSSGVISNSSVLSATPAATYAHVNDRKNEAEIFRQLLNPRFGDGVDVVIGNGLEDVLRAAGFGFYDSLDAIPGNARRAVVLFNGDFGRMTRSSYSPPTTRTTFASAAAAVKASQSCPLPLMSISATIWIASSSIKSGAMTTILASTSWWQRVDLAPNASAASSPIPICSTS